VAASRKFLRWLVEVELLAAQWHTFGGPDADDYWANRGYRWGAGGGEPWPARPLKDWRVRRWLAGWLAAHMWANRGPS
jgi:hypothetical protein